MAIKYENTNHVEPKPASQMDHAQAALLSCIENLAGEVNALEKQLDGVMKPCTGDTEAQRDVPKREITARYVDQVHEASEVINKLAIQLHAIQKRLCV